MPPPATVPPIIENAGELLSGYDAVFCDIWGVVHNGVTEYTAAGAALERYRAEGGVVVLLSNSPAPSPGVEQILAAKSVRRAAFDRIVSSGDLTRARMRELCVGRIHHVGPDRDLGLFAGQAVVLVDMASAEVLVATGLIDENNETAEDYRRLFQPMVDRKVAMICANPDRIVDVGGVLLQCAGALGDVYEDLGGSVYWEGKPYSHAYDAALLAAEAVAGRTLDRRRILAIGDSITTDMRGATEAGLDALFIAQGIHRDALMQAGQFDPDLLGDLLAPSGYAPVAAMVGLDW